MAERFEIVVVGGGHAGIEAAHAAVKMGCRCALVTMNLEAVGRMSCNPAIGGVAKGQLVRDIDALGGLMGKLADIAGIQFRMLNRSKGPAVWGPRAQMDLFLYSRRARQILSELESLTLIEAEVAAVNSTGAGDMTVYLKDGGNILCRAVIVTAGTFLRALMYSGLAPVSGGRVGEAPSNALSDSLKAAGLKLRRLKTGTPSRVDRTSVDLSKCRVQPGDAHPFPFSARTSFPLRNDQVCWITHTTPLTHDLLREGFDESPMFRGVIRGVGPRYCPSIEDKVNRFPDKDSHQLFLEPEGVNSPRMYVNGFSSSLPAAVQERALKSIPGLENCSILQIGYAVEYDAVFATQLHPTYECRAWPGLYFAGQVNGTSGYEEAAAQGLMAGINAALKIKEKAPFILSRADSYIGVMTDDLVNVLIEEPYRLFTSRAEYRLFLRQDNAECRLLEKAGRLGLMDKSDLEKTAAILEARAALTARLAEAKVAPDQINRMLEAEGKGCVKQAHRALDLLRRPDISLPRLLNVLGWTTGLSSRDILAIESEVLYAGFYERQKREIDRINKLSSLRIPVDFEYDKAVSMCLEAREKLKIARPLTVHLAAKVPGVKPVDLSGLIFHLNRSHPSGRPNAPSA